MEWQPVRDYEGRYEVSRCGRVRKVNGPEIGQWRQSDDYMMVRLSRPRAMKRVHRLVAGAFVPNPQNLPNVNHLNHSRPDNRAENLEWCSQQQNLAHARKHGRMPDDYWHGKRSPNAALSNDTVCDIRTEYEKGQQSYAGLAKKHGISKRAIGRLIKRETYADV